MSWMTRSTGSCRSVARPASGASACRLVMSCRENRTSSAVLTARRTFARVLRELIAQYAGDDADVDEEIDDLYRILSARTA
jgi:hypothetical protein